MKIRYIRKVDLPEHLAGDVDQVREIDDQQAFRLIGEGYCVYEGTPPPHAVITSPPPAKPAKSKPADPVV